MKATPLQIVLEEMWITGLQGQLPDSTIAEIERRTKLVTTRLSKEKEQK